MRIEEIFGDVRSIDVISQKGSCVELIMIVNGYAGDSDGELEALDRKLTYYNSWAESDEFKALYGGEDVSVTVTFTEKPSGAVMSRLHEWREQMQIDLKVMISGLPMMFI